ncbi:2-oxoacid:ferredoxin oxidoreductase subunit alpha [Candidatus Acidianus copahuensis]|uniref:2-oxoacid oxidoreductase (ferredoxin) n=1 Tax=Candidatus Acidianus copahuensis TaxID=1160895 RepID=A0A031LN49_9CREN|nr:2-oxoacid:ferredoxin oxidoreductase subunit alpha [Candidatus Acidianus copahuensis]EZQ04926.1 2-oxoacid:ferredoxin oxidoreductase subunit alpha [Candidatus Acidianus copahuensis]
MKISWMIGGAQGTGVDTSANIFGNALAEAGYYIYGNREYYSNIKGRHSYFNLTISDKRTHSIRQKVEILASFDAETVFQHFDDVTKVIIYNTGVKDTSIDRVQSMEPEVAERVKAKLKSAGFDTTVGGALKYAENKGVKTIEVNYDEILKKVASAMSVPLSVAERGKNTAAIAASYSLLGLNRSHLFNAIKRTFRQETFVKLNSLVVEQTSVPSMFNLNEIPREGRRVQLDGNTAVAMGKIYGGIGFQSYYPITPASDESFYIEEHQEVLYEDPETGDKRKRTIVVVQAEDELAAVNMAIGASLTGVRAATATSGPGFSLMAEGIGWAGMNEAPVVVTFYMRGGPSTGLPTRTSQSDLLFAMHAGHGEFPRIVIASGDHAESFADAVLAFNLAERYQTPVIHLVEKALANAYSIMDVDELGLDKIRAERGKILKVDKRFMVTDDGISPRILLGEHPIFYTGDEHNEEGHISEDVENRTTMYAKRMRKLETADREIPEEERIKVFGNPNSKIAIITWGSPKGSVLDAVEDLGEDIEVIQLRIFSPFPRKLIPNLLKGKEAIIDVEGNYEAQAAQVMKEYTGIEPTHYVLKWNGRPMGSDEVTEGIRRALSGERKVVLNGGA